MSRSQLLAMARRNLAHVKAGTVDQAADVYRVPAVNYHDPDRWNLEMKRIFKRLPLLLGFSCEMREVGSYRSVLVADIPILLTRVQDGSLRAFLNVCSHRGSVIVPEGSGRGTRFACPYHAWTYDNEGALRSVFKEEDFGQVDKSELGLTPLPVAERAGLVFVIPTPEASLEIDTFLCGYDELLAHHGFEDCELVGRQVLTGPNWKIAYDGYLDFYHLPILHRETFGPDIQSDSLFDAWGPHQRVSMPNSEYLEFEDLPDEDWNLEEVLGGVWTIFPHVSIADFDAGGKLYLVSQLFPGPGPEESTTIQNFLATSKPDAAQRELIDEQIEFLRHVVQDEDYATGNRIQKAVKTGAKSEVLFGRNEGGGQSFHRWVERFLEADDDALPGLFSTGEDGVSDKRDV